MKKSLSLLSMNQNQMAKAAAGVTWSINCSCGCAYKNCGGSSNQDNFEANRKLRFKVTRETPAC